MEKVKVAVIGCGTIAKGQHIPAYMKNEQVEIVYFCDIIKERAEAAVEKNGCGIAVTDYKQVLADPQIDAVSVCTPNKMHSIITIDALKAGKHVLCEKPAARTLDEVLAMQEAQHESGKILNIGVVNRFNDNVNRIRNFIQDGKLGEVFHVYLSFRSHRSIPGLGGAFTTKEIAGGGVLVDWGVHFLDLVMYCLGDPKPLTVSGETFCKLGKDIPAYTFKDMWAGPPVLDGIYDVEESVTAVVRTEGPTFTVHGAWAQNIGEDEMFVDFMGDKGGIRLQYGKDFTYYTAEHGALVSYTPEAKSSNMFQNEINAFINCVRTGEKIASHIDTAVITAKIMQGIYDSAAQHREVVLD